MGLGGHCCVVRQPCSRLLCDWKEQPSIGSDVDRSGIAGIAQEPEKSRGRSRLDPSTNQQDRCHASA